MITTLQNSNLTVKINKLGAELFSLTNAAQDEFMWSGDPTIWGKHAPILFPIVGTLKNNNYNYQGQTYHLTRHGFARDMHFDVKDVSQNHAVFSLVASAKTLAIYPFDFELQIRYSLQESLLSVAYTVINHGNHLMPFAIGAHPAFALAGKFTDYSLIFEKDETLQYHVLADDLVSDETKILTSWNGKVALAADLFANDALIFKKIASKQLCIAKKDKPFLKVHFSDFPNLGIWNKVNAAFVCIEPWHGYSDTPHATGNLFEKEGMLQLISKKSFEAQYSIEILQ